MVNKSQNHNLTVDNKERIIEKSPPMQVSKIWTDEEIEILKTLYPRIDISIEEIKQKLPNRTHQAINKKASCLNIIRFGIKNYPWNKNKTLPQETKDKIRQSVKALNIKGENHPFYGKHHSEESNEKNRIAHLGRKESEETLQKKRGKIPWNRGLKTSDEVREKLSKSHIGIQAGENCPMYGRTGEKSPNWHGGISFDPYCLKFNENFKERVREYFGRCCYVCGKNEIDNKERLSVHHVAYNKDTCCDDSKPLFVPLCHGCHTKTNHNRDFREEFFTVSLDFLTNGECYTKKDINKLRINTR